MKTKQPKIYLTVEIDQSRYLSDEDYDGIDTDELLDRVALARLLDKGYCTVKIGLEKQILSSTSQALVPENVVIEVK